MCGVDGEETILKNRGKCTKKWQSQKGSKKYLSDRAERRGELFPRLYNLYGHRELLPFSSIMAFWMSRGQAQPRVYSISCTSLAAYVSDIHANPKRSLARKHICVVDRCQERRLAGLVLAGIRAGAGPGRRLPFWGIAHKQRPGATKGTNVDVGDLWPCDLSTCTDRLGFPIHLSFQSKHTRK